MRRAIISLFFIGLALGASMSFDEFIVKYKRSYKTQEEYNYRLSVFEASAERARQSQHYNGGSATFGVTEFSDMTPEEFRAAKLMNDLGLDNEPVEYNDNIPATQQVGITCDPDATNFNWKSCGAVLGVRNQQQCGSCWAFSASETIESYCILAGGPSEFLSPQQIVDCDSAMQGCGGGYPWAAYEYVQQAGGLETEAEYPYTAEQGTCHFKKSKAVCTTTGYFNVSGETGMYSQLSSNTGGPISVIVDASSWQDYTGGVITNCTDNLDHAVQATGYANYGDSDKAYWIVRNSWGTSWGEQGYIWLQIGSNMCGIASYPTVPHVKVLSN